MNPLLLGFNENRFKGFPDSEREEIMSRLREHYEPRTWNEAMRILNEEEAKKPPGATAWEALGQFFNLFSNPGGAIDQ